MKLTVSTGWKLDGNGQNLCQSKKAFSTSVAYQDDSHNVPIVFIELSRH